MVNEKRLKAMIRLAEYEKNGSGELRICRYSRRDYLILSLIRTFFLTTIGFGLLLLLAAIGAGAGALTARAASRTRESH